MVRGQRNGTECRSWLELLNEHLEPPPDESDLRANLGRFVEQVRSLWYEEWPAYFLIDGARLGVGKSSCGITLARALCPRFGMSGFAWRGRELEGRLVEAGEWGFVILDEPDDLVASRGARDEELRHIMSTLGRFRKNHVGVALIAPDKSWYDALVSRGRLCPWWIFVEEPGIARTHELWKRPSYRLSQRFAPYDRSLRFSFNRVDPSFFDSYNDAAREKNLEYAREGAEREARREEKRRARTDSTTGPDRPLTEGGVVVPEPVVCPWCGRDVDNQYNLVKHQRKCKSRPA